MPRSSFISDLKYIESAVRRGVVPERGCHVFGRLAEFVEAGSFTSSKNMKFLCRYWNRSYEDLGRIWAGQGYGEKRQETFRVQASNLGRMLYSLFPAFCRELFVSESVWEGEEAGLAEIEITIDALQNLPGLPEEMLVGEVVCYPDSNFHRKGITVEECRGTVRKLKPLMRQEVFRYLDGVDTDQLKFILSVLKRPLFGARSVTCDPEKLELLKAFGVSEPAGIAEPEWKAQPEKAVTEVLKKTSYNLPFGRHLLDILMQRADARVTHDEAKEWQGMAERERDAYKRKLANFLSVFTEEGFRRQMAHYNPLAVREVLEGGYPVWDGEKSCRFKK